MRLAALCLVALVGCAPAGDRLEQSHHALVGGSPSTADDDSVVALLTPLEGGGKQLCTGTLVAPNLVVTARHCVTYAAEVLSCTKVGNPSGGPFFGETKVAGAIEIFVGPPRPEPLVSTADAHGKTIVQPTTSDGCTDDVALVVLDRDLPNAKLTPLRLDAPAIAGEAITVVGYGITPSGPPDERQRRESTIEIVGPADPALPAGVMDLTANMACLGDSGSPVLAKSDRALVGVNNFADPSGCSEASKFSRAIAIAPHKTTVLAAFAAAGHEPIVTGGASPSPTDAGTSAPEGTTAKGPTGTPPRGDESGCGMTRSSSTSAMAALLAAATCAALRRRRWRGT